MSVIKLWLHLLQENCSCILSCNKYLDSFALPVVLSWQAVCIKGLCMFSLCSLFIDVLTVFAVVKFSTRTHLSTGKSLRFWRLFECENGVS